MKSSPISCLGRSLAMTFAIGGIPNSDMLGLGATGIATGGKGFIPVKEAGR